MNLNFKEYGSGEPVIILHGLLGMLDNWHSFAKKLSSDYWVISVDQRNHGKSFHSDAFNYDLLTHDLKEFMDQNHIPKAHFIGHSMGGKTVLNFINTYPEMSDKNVIVDISPKEYTGGHEEVFEALSNLPLSTINSRIEAAELLLQTLHYEGLVNFLLKNLLRNKDGSFSWKANIQSLTDNYDKIIGEISFNETVDAPTLFIQGEQSDYIDNEDQRLLEDNFTNFRIKKINNAGHWVHVDQPDELLEDVKNFLLE